MNACQRSIDCDFFVREELLRLQEALEANLSAAEMRVKTRREEELTSMK
jgi:hypothetical protein